LFNKIAGSDFERTKCGPEGVEHRDGRNNPGSPAIQKSPFSGVFFYVFLQEVRKEPVFQKIAGSHFS
jgi:hypothetical protein